MTEASKANIKRNVAAMKKQLDEGTGCAPSLEFAIGECEELLREDEGFCHHCGETSCDDPKCYEQFWA